ncbi:uncharacterized protein F5147DRAFT_777973 [Suillus discolor]|uniref:Uncharacterized protein n=1 Tax=Suillus discolor TaxID=1912936 RepID=A0A9P7JQB3_9AGAM|nr:uncharacterized protein F5147DRAFT_777973 [Suillus discolor]KAG2097519.1 hypothetical protein F5147DRAFT_777973 [Suillus discolor]
MSSESKGWLPTSSSNTTSTFIPPAKQCLQQQLQKPAKPTITSPMERQLPEKQVLADLKAAIQARLNLTDDNQASLSLEHCAVILEALQNPQSNTIIGRFVIVIERYLTPFKVIIGITPAEYTAVLAFTSEERDFEVQAKFTYFEDTQELQIMPPLPIVKNVLKGRI